MSKNVLFSCNNKNYKYIIYAIFFSLLNNLLTEINYYGAFDSLRLFPTNKQKEFFKHSYIHKIFSYLGIFILSNIFYFNEKKITKPKKNVFIKSPKSSFESELIYENLEENQVSDISFHFVLFILFLLIILDQAIDKYNCTLCHLDFWMFELIIISLLNLKLSNIEIYKHQIFVFYLNILPILYKIITIYFVYKGDQENKDNKFEDKKNNLRYIYLVYWYAIPIGLIFYLVFITLRAYVYIKIKWLMDIKYISINKLLILYGFIGTLFYLILCIISTIKECNRDSEKNIYDYICNIYKIEIRDNITITKKYFENFSIYWDITRNVWEILVEILVIVLGMVTSFFYKYYFMIIIKNLTPAHIIFLSPIYFFVFKIVLLIVNIFIRLFKGGPLMEKSVPYVKHNFSLDMFGDVFSFLGFLVYLEIIELNFCNLNFNIRKNIIKRGIDESLTFTDNNIGNFTDSFSEDSEKNKVENENFNGLINLSLVK